MKLVWFRKQNACAMVGLSYATLNLDQCWESHLASYAVLTSKVCVTLKQLLYLIINPS